MYRINLLNQRFTKLTVLDYIEDYKTKNGNIYPRWKCICDCQLTLPEEERKYTYVRTHDLIRQNVKSCGCLKTQKTKERNKKYNKYDLETYDYGIGYLSNGDKFLFDKGDYDLIKNYYWNTDKDGYVVSYINKKCTEYDVNKYILSRKVMKYKGVYKIDHINHNLLDNRKSNLRISTTSQNGMNRTIGKNNSSGCSGVHQDKYGKWISRIQKDKKRIVLGRFNTKEEAIKIRKEAEEKYYGEWSYDNSLKNDLN